jgi:dipeptidyl aminopeptidase/acylaminoacyl peptidase
VANEAGGLQRGISWSPDGNWIAYATVRNGRYVLMRAPVGSGGVEVISRDCGEFPAWSPGGDELATIEPGGGILLLKADGSPARRAGSGRWLALAWTRHGSFVIGIARTDEGRLALVEVAPGNGTQSVLQDLGPWPAAFSFGLATGMYPVRGISVAPDQRTVTFAALDVNSDVWLLKGLSEPGLLERWRR